jgi:transposase
VPFLTAFPQVLGLNFADRDRYSTLSRTANIKLASVVSKIDGVSSMNMIQAPLKKNKLSRDEIADLSRGRLKNKVDQLGEALNGKVTDHHRFLLRLHLNNIAFLAEKIQ